MNGTPLPRTSSALVVDHGPDLEDVLEGAGVGVYASTWCVLTHGAGGPVQVHCPSDIGDQELVDALAAAARAVGLVVLEQDPQVA